AAIAVDAAPVAPVAPPVDAAVARLPIASPGTADAARHLAAAEDARRTANHLRQIAEADAALRADPHSRRARFLLADGLIDSGDFDRGCKYLHELGRNSEAQARARKAGCPSE